MQALLTIGEAAERLKLNPETVRRQLRTGALRGIKRGRLWRVPADAIFEATPEKSKAPEVAAQIIMRGLYGDDATARSAAIVALASAGADVRAIVERSAAQQATEGNDAA